MNIASKDLLQDLVKRTQNNLKEAEKFNELSIEMLNGRNAPGSWSILECLEHLNLYGDFYLPEIENRMSASNKEGTPIFKSGFLGNYFAKSMLPKEKLNKMTTFKDKDPINKTLDKKCIDRFIRQQKKTLELLDIAGNKDLSKVKTSISISKWMKLKLGDTFRVLIYHNERHVVQANKIAHR
ncbi:DinB family protein [Fulvivirga sp. M361]|uniref:DinB family protein n=1 Tax=Fulvivirga sp. M361 TaxID=2594266 RepID=UPI00117A779F|nr:DinB family protein [Fulvivirga sp. M361]TRX59453.1 DinB family protein [Fulvivirga sp. M361]